MRVVAHVHPRGVARRGRGPARSLRGGAGRRSRRRRAAGADDRLAAVRRGLPRHGVCAGRGAARLRLAQGQEDVDPAGPRAGERHRQPDRERVHQPRRPRWLRRRARAERLRRSSCTTTSTGASTSSASTRAGSATRIRCTASTARTSSTPSSSPVPLFPYQHDQYRPFYDQYTSLADLCLEPRRADRRAHEHRRRRPRPRPAAPGGRRPQAELPGVLVRELPREHVRQPLPEERARAGHRRRARPAPLVERPPDRVRPGRHAGGVRRVPAPLQGGGPGLRVRGRKADGEAVGDARPDDRGRAARPRRRLPLHVRLPDRRRHERDVLPRGLGRPRGLRSLPRLRRRRGARRPVGEGEGAGRCAAASSRRCRRRSRSRTTTTGSTRTSATSAPTRSTPTASTSSGRSTGSRGRGRASAPTGGGSTARAPTGR